ncbi:hypothetical protein Rhopal_007848-T1 [Rhodotorula paludigena]|uniref:MARVEL domain-containing protein n=1 Tax=Rhodotorula paludigena TaxID=86838 RepID=A0AAV5GQ90_9BASI|nr:hypothetical protein Rhopal_007848-T1 [Rhodotorula paludigena]
MGACCSTASRSAVLASSFVIVVSVPVLFYSCILLRFRSAELQSTGFTVFTVVAFAISFLTAVLGIVGRDCHHVPTLRVAQAAGFLATALALAYTVWGSIVLSSMFDYPESRALMIGTVRLSLPLPSALDVC